MLTIIYIPRVCEISEYHHDNKTKQNKTKQNKTKQNKTKQHIFNPGIFSLEFVS